MTDQDAPNQADPLQVVRRDLGEGHADLQQVQSVVLREGPRSKKTARYVAVRNRHTGEVHHHALTLETGKKIKGSWELDDKRSTSFSDEEDDEVARLMDFLRRVHPTGEPAVVESGSGGPISERLAAIAKDPDALQGLVRAVREAPEAFAGVAAAMGFGRHAHAVETLKKRVAAEASVAELRDVLRSNWWLVGSEYGAPVDAEAIGDVLLQRSPDGRLEAVLVGEASGAEPLFEGDAPGAVLNRWLGEAMRVRELLAAAGEVSLALVIGTRADEASSEALKRLNMHVRGIRVLTYLEVLQRGQRVLDVLRATAKGQG
ncbi:MAG: hypothetical protein ACK46X_03260 [Candidatus Sericytochromatia bacterium]